MAHRGQYEPQYGPLHPSHQKACENGTEGHSEPDHCPTKEEREALWTVQLYLPFIIRPAQVPTL